MSETESLGEKTPEAVSESIRPAMTKLYVTYFRKAAQSALTGPQLTILTHLADGIPERISDVARKEGIRMPTASNSLHQLEQRNLVERVRDESDRRGVFVKITEEGLRELTRVGDERTQYFAEMLRTLDQDELNLVADLVPVINKMADLYSVQAPE
ncbi:HTH-type transcriptional regulator MgrA [Corynebacterium kalinowskii]|uniref:HTH-type transcriptional regulator MgrA n=1 Tax=Corynebacterium kalinowskii TaxID=2675216 RepID=A0A6B8VP51_9CORY|nr:MarR family winged helix-turn-helix transcriptional regulator [Corynebacterium kalinowskii]QGU03194.1 HTH-type transcriptional regulator MgrA [Corynebacterium kalinowskii]